MQFTLASLAVPLGLIQVAAAQNYLGVIFSGTNYEGVSRVFYPPGGNCVNLTPPLKNNVHSIQVTPGARCELFYFQNCRQQRASYENSQPNIPGTSALESVRCSFLGEED